MRMRGGHLGHWYQPIARANANGGHGGCHLHNLREWAVIGLESLNNLCGHYGSHVL